MQAPCRSLEFQPLAFGAMTIGSAVWGKVASEWGLAATLYIAAAGAFVAMIATYSSTTTKTTR